MRLLKIAAGLLLLLALLVGAGGWFVANTARTKLDDARARLASDWKAFEPRVVADEARWKADPLFAPHPGGDAAPVLFAHVRFEKDGKPPPVPVELTEALKAAGADWAKRSADFEVSAIDTAWMAQLGSFGWWDVEGQGTPLERRTFEVMTEPLPVFTDLQAFAKVRLLQGLQSGSLVEAGKEVRELARLCLTNETLVGAMVGTALLGIERRAHEEAASRGLDLTGWTPISEADQASLRNLLWAAQARHTLLAPEPLANRPFAVGECTSLREGVGQALFLRGYLGDDLPERYASLAKTLETSSCRLRRARLAWSSTGPAAGELPVKGSTLCLQEPGVEPTDCAVPDGVMHLPFARAFIGRTLAVIATPDWFAKYREANVTP